jgi:hypothetical protein
MRRIPFWRAADAVARITRKLAERCGGGDLGVFLPTVDAKFKRTSPPWETGSSLPFTE